MNGSVQWAFEYFYHLDKANACMHCAPVKFSPITFRLCEQLESQWRPEEAVITIEMAEVLRHKGTYEEDPGR